MIIKVICSECDKIFDWEWKKESGECEHCGAKLWLKEVHFAPNEILKVFNDDKERDKKKE